MRHLDFILKHLPKPGRDERHFVDVFGGSGVVVLNVGYKERTYNDRNERLVNFFRVLRDRPEDLLPKIELTPHSRVEFEESRDRVPDDYDGDRDVEDARRLMVDLFQCYNNMPGRSNSWGVHRERHLGSTRARTWALKMPEQLATIVERLRTIQIECMDGLELLRRSDHLANVVYLDPPYLHETRGDKSSYGSMEMSDVAHRELVEILRGMKNAKVAVSAYANSIYDSLGWQRVEHATVAQMDFTSRTEVMYMNYELPRAGLLDR